MTNSNLRRKGTKGARNSSTGAIGQAAAAEKNRQQGVRTCIVQAFFRLEIPSSELPDFVQLHYTGAQGQKRYRQLLSPSAFHPSAFDRLSQSKEEWAKTVDTEWEQHRDKRVSCEPET